MATGAVVYHVDFSNYFVILFPIKTPPIEGKGKGKGGLEFSVGLDSIMFAWRVGDVVMFDAGDIPHRTRDFKGAPEGRLTGTLMIRKDMLRYYNVLEVMDSHKLKTEGEFQEMKKQFKPYCHLRIKKIQDDHSKNKR